MKWSCKVLRLILPAQQEQSSSGHKNAFKWDADDDYAIELQILTCKSYFFLLHLHITVQSNVQVQQELFDYTFYILDYTWPVKTATLLTTI